MDIHDKYPFFARFYYEFFIGAMLAVVFYKIEDTLYDIKRKPKLSMVMRAFNFVCGVASVALIFEGYKYFSGFFTPKRDHMKVSENMYEGTFYWSVFIISMLIDWFSTNKFMTTCGTFSFGMYLYHPMCIMFVQYSNPRSKLGTLYSIGCFNVVSGMRLIPFVGEEIDCSISQLYRHVREIFEKYPTSVRNIILSRDCLACL